MTAENSHPCVSLTTCCRKKLSMQRGDSGIGRNQNRTVAMQVNIYFNCNLRTVLSYPLQLTHAKSITLISSSISKLVPQLWVFSFFFSFNIAVNTYLPSLMNSSADSICLLSFFTCL